MALGQFSMSPEPVSVCGVWIQGRELQGTRFRVQGYPKKARRNTCSFCIRLEAEKLSVKKRRLTGDGSCKQLLKSFIDDLGRTGSNRIPRHCSFRHGFSRNSAVILAVLVKIRETRTVSIS